MRAPTILGATSDEPSVPPSSSGEPRGAAVAAVLRRRATTAPLWIDVVGASMGAAIPDGSRVLVDVGVRPRRGEVWAFCLPDGTIVVHRFRRRVGVRLRFQGDAKPQPDELVDAAQLVGRVTSVDTGSATIALGWPALLVARVRLDAAAAKWHVAAWIRRS